MHPFMTDQDPLTRGSGRRGTEEMENVENVVISLTDLLKQQQVVAPSVYDNISVRAVELCHFPAAVLSGAGLAYSMCGLPDLGLLNIEEMKWMVQRMTYYTPLPVIADAGNGFGEAAVQVGFNVMRLVKAGAKAVIVDDSAGLRGRDVQFLEDEKVELVSRELFEAKIRAAVEACENTDAVVIARTEALLSKGLEEAIERCALARKAGAYLTEVDGAATLEEAKKINEGDPGLKMWPFIETVDGKPAMGRDELDALGFRLIGMWYTEKASMYGMLLFGKRTLEDGNTVFHNDHNFDGLLKPGQTHHVLFSYWKKWIPLEDECYDRAAWAMTKEYDIQFKE